MRRTGGWGNMKLPHPPIASYHDPPRSRWYARGAGGVPSWLAPVCTPVSLLHRGGGVVRPTQPRIHSKDAPVHHNRPRASSHLNLSEEGCRGAQFLWCTDAPQAQGPQRLESTQAPHEHDSPTPYILVKFPLVWQNKNVMTIVMFSRKKRLLNMS